MELPADDIYLTEEAKALKRWSALYAAELKRLGYIGEAQIASEVKRLIERGVRVPGRGSRIGIIVPDLEQYRKAIIREFTAELSPGAVLPGAPDDPVFNISLGAPLSE